MSKTMKQEQLPAVNEVAAIMSVIERAATNPDVNIERMQALLEMQERILDRNARQAFTSALARMQSELPSIVENGAIAVNGQVRSKYARFEDINDVVRPILQKHGFAITFRVNQIEAQIEVKAVLSHEDGHAEETSMRLPADNSGSKNSVQAVGSSVSYGKRYTMCALLNITSKGEDDNGGAAGDKLVTQVQADLITEKLMKCSSDIKENFASKYGMTTNVPKAEFDKVIAYLNKNIAGDGK